MLRLPMAAVSLLASLAILGQTTATASHITTFGAVDAIDHVFPAGGGMFAALPTSPSDDAWLVFAANAGDSLSITGVGIFGPNMVVFREVTNGIVEVGDVAGVSNFNVNQFGNGIDLVVQHPGFNGSGVDQYVTTTTPRTISFLAPATGQYVIGISPANESSSFLGTTNVTLRGNTASVNAVPEPGSMILWGTVVLSLAAGAYVTRQRTSQVVLN